MKPINYLIFFILISIANMNYAKVINPDFSGIWCWDKDSQNSTFSLVIKKNAKIYKAGYFAVAYAGDKIDENEQAFIFKISSKKKIRTTIKSGIRGKIGIIQLQIVGKKLEWVILKSPEGEFYTPQKALLHRCNG